MKNIRRGLGKGLGTGYKNLAPMDSHIHSLSAKGQKTYPDWYAKEIKPIVTKGNEKITITCANCGYKIKDFSNIFEGNETSYVCPRCRYEGFAFESNTKLNAKGKDPVLLKLEEEERKHYQNVLRREAKLENYNNELERLDNIERCSLCGKSPIERDMMCSQCLNKIRKWEKEQSDLTFQIGTHKVNSLLYNRWKRNNPNGTEEDYNKDYSYNQIKRLGEMSEKNFEKWLNEEFPIKKSKAKNKSIKKSGDINELFDLDAKGKTILYTQKQINKKYKGKYIDIYKTYDYTNQEYKYEVRNVFKNIHENTTLGEDVGTSLEYTRWN